MLLNKYQYLDDSVITYINSKIQNRSDFNEDAFIDWLESNDVQSKSNPSSYVRSCFTRELNEGRFFRKPEEKVIKQNLNLQPLFNDMRANGIVVNQDDTLFLNIFFDYLITNGILTIEELKHNNHEGMKYIISHGLKSSTDFIALFKKSRALKGKNIDYQLIQDQYEKELKEWQELMKDLEDSKKEDPNSMPWEEEN